MLRGLVIVDIVSKKRTIVIIAIFFIAVATFIIIKQANRSKSEMTASEVARLHSSNWTLIYADNNSNRTVCAYTQGKSRFLADSPIGCMDLGHWIGYSNKRNSILLHRFEEDSFRELRVYPNKGRITSNKYSSCSKECFPYDYSIHNGRLWFIRGSGSCAELCYKKSDGSIKCVSSWKMPKSVGISKNWTSVPLVRNLRVVFVTPSLHIVLAKIGSSRVQVLVKGKKHYHDPGYEDTASGRFLTCLSPDGNILAFVPWPTIDIKHSQIFVLDIKTGRKKQYYFLDTRGLIYKLLEPLSPPVKLIWIPKTDFLACELHGGISAGSLIAILNVRNGKSLLLPIRNQNHQWCIIPGESGS
jgi:hypothetical protein